MKNSYKILVFALLLIFIIGIQKAYPAGLEEYGNPEGFGEEQDNVYTNDLYYSEIEGRMETGNDNYSVSDDDAAYFGNANKTGLEPVNKALEGQTTHGEYTKNSNSCATCHMTHTAAGTKLLFRHGIYNTCTACHDGTLGFYNVFREGTELREEMGEEHYVENLYAAGGGTFRGEDGTGASLHLSTGSLTIAAAPGGHRTSDNTEITNGESTWGADFTCASCHSPHGSYSDRLLHFNPNNIGNTTLKNGGFKREDVRAWKVDYNDKKVYVVAKEDEIDYDDGSGIVSNFFNRDKTPWLYGFEGIKPKEYWTKISVYNSAGELIEPSPEKAWNDIFDINYPEAYFEIPVEARDKNGNTIPDDAVIIMDVAQALVVKFEMAIDDSEKGIKIVKNYGENTNISIFCSACHTDYNQTDEELERNPATQLFNSAKTEVGQPRGTFTLGYRHNIDKEIKPGMVGTEYGEMVCLTCHYAHGTTKAIMLEADNRYSATADNNPSSALKRYVNQAVCMRCHAESVSYIFKNSDDYWNNDSDFQMILSSYDLYK